MTNKISIDALTHDLEAPVAVRRFGSGWFSGFFALLLAIGACGMVAALRWPDWFSTPELQKIEATAAFRVGVHAMLLGAYALALVSLLLRPRKVLGFAALAVALGATVLGGANVQPRETQSWGIFFGLDFFVVNMIATGLMFAPIERLLAHRPEQRLFRQEWREDLFYYLVSSMAVQMLTFLTLAPSTFINAKTGGMADFRGLVAGQPWIVQLAEIMLLTDLMQYWFHRTFHKVPFLWGFHAVHHSSKSMDWLAGARMHVVEIVLMRAVTSLPLLTLGFAPSAMQAYVAVVYITSSLVHANLRGNFDRLGKFFVTPRFHHWHHGLEEEAVDVNFAIHFPWIDKLFGTYHMPGDRWPKDYGVPETVPQGYLKQMTYPWARHKASKQPA